MDSSKRRRTDGLSCTEKNDDGCGSDVPELVDSVNCEMSEGENESDSSSSVVSDMVC